MIVYTCNRRSAGLEINISYLQDKLGMLIFHTFFLLLTLFRKPDKLSVASMYYIVLQSQASYLSLSLSLLYFENKYNIYHIIFRCLL